MEKQQINCSVKDCMYNENGKVCGLDSIKIGYFHDPISSEQQSLCADFCRRGQVRSDVDLEGKRYR
ncbi:MAG: DUF1540 domain-containing protein [Syntrophomonadaceae bacterium]|nr:DUF1540 domain-containing protein [Syntrophomonadaceae bacterium]